MSDIPRCRDCAHFKETYVFDLCAHAEATYKIAEREDQHTVTHMRRTRCGPEGKLFTEKGLPA
jgi:hypothetical protein